MIATSSSLTFLLGKVICDIQLSYIECIVDGNGENINNISPLQCASNVTVDMLQACTCHHLCKSNNANNCRIVYTSW